MLFFRFEAVPDPSHDRVSELGGAYIHFWVVSKDQAEAESLVRAEMATSHWRPIELLERSTVEFCDYDEGHPSREYFRAAFVHGMVVVTHTYPIDESPEVARGD